MRRSLQSILLSITTLLSIYTPVHAEILTLPRLSDVIIENENYQKTIRKTTRRNKPISSLALWNTEILSYHTLDSGRAITLSKYDTIDLWVQEIDLSKWWRIESDLILGWYDELSGEPLFEKRKISEVRSSLANSPYSIFNGQFFDPKRSITPLSFGIKVDGIVRTAGADNRDESKNILVLEKNIAKIIPYSWENLRDAPGYFAMVNLTLGTWHYRDESIGRTYICLKNPNIENESKVLLVFTASSMTEPALESEIRRWWCTRDSTTKLDSSWSTRLYFQGSTIYGYSHKGNPDYRSIPHSLVVYDGSI